MARLAIVCTLALAAGCPRAPAPEPEPAPATHPTPPRPSDSTREGAVAIPYDAKTERWELTGTLDAAAGDDVDWLVVELSPRLAYRLDVSVMPEGENVVCESSVVRDDGKVLEASPQYVAAGRAFEPRRIMHATTRLYVRVAASGACRAGAYEVRVKPVLTTPWKPGDPPPCDREDFDASNPNCAGKCDYQHPDGENVDCCDLWDRCRLYPNRDCLSSDVTVEGDVVSIPLGTNQGIFGRPWATLRLSSERYPGDETVGLRMSKAIELVLKTIEPDRSEWRIQHIRLYDAAWVKSHARQVTLRPPTICN